MQIILTMARFIGSKQEFLDLFGATLLTNAVKYYGRSIRKRKVCQHCRKQGEVQAAHIKGTPGRIEIANSILDQYYTPDTSKDIVDVNILEFLGKFYESHLPLESHFIPLCDSCHKEYDKEDVKNRRPAGSNPFGRFGMPK